MSVQDSCNRHAAPQVPFKANFCAPPAAFVTANRRNVTACIEECQATSPFLPPSGSGRPPSSASSLFPGRSGSSSSSAAGTPQKDAETRRALRVVISLGAVLFAACCAVIAYHHSAASDGQGALCPSFCSVCCWCVEIERHLLPVPAHHHHKWRCRTLPAASTRQRSFLCRSSPLSTQPGRRPHGPLRRQRLRQPPGQGGPLRVRHPVLQPHGHRRPQLRPPRGPLPGLPPRRPQAGHPVRRVRGGAAGGPPRHHRPQWQRQGARARGKCVLPRRPASINDPPPSSRFHLPPTTVDEESS